MKNQLNSPSAVPEAQSDGDPTSYADCLGRWYAERIDESHRKAHGHYATPLPIARFMGQLSCIAADAVRVLDPAAGAGMLAAAACQALAEASRPPRRIELVAYEIDAGLRPGLEACLEHLRVWLARRNIELIARVEWRDFILANAGALDGGILPPAERPMDAVICNPPYFKLPKSDARAQACSPVVYGQPNIYGLFMAVSAAMLREGGRFVFISPRSYASGPYFQRFREVFFGTIRPTHIHVFESRTEAFDAVLQETLITAGTKDLAWYKRPAAQQVCISASAGADDIEARKIRSLPLSEILRGDCKYRVLNLPANEEHDRIRALVNGWPGSLHAYGWDVSTGPVVAFRAREFLLNEPGGDTVPLLWLQNVSGMSTKWPIDNRKAQYVQYCAGSAPLVLPNLNYVLLRRFSAKEEKRRLTAAPHIARTLPYGKIGLENHLNYIHKPGGQLTEDDAFGLAALLNSRLLDAYFRISNGNTQVSATELRALPLPRLAVIRRIGSRVRSSIPCLDRIMAEEIGDDG